MTSSSCRSYSPNFTLMLNFIWLKVIVNLSERSNLSSANYDVQSAKFHIRKLRDLLQMAVSKETRISSVFSSLQVSEDNPKPESQKKNNKGSSNSSSEKPVLSKEEIRKLEVTLEKDGRLCEYYPQEEIPIKCLRTLAYSGWNPPPGNRRLQGILPYVLKRLLEINLVWGDLFYLEVTTLENKDIEITAWTKGEQDTCFSS